MAAAKKIQASAKTVAERQAALRNRRLEVGLTEVRGLYAKVTHHRNIKAFAKSLLVPVKKT